MIVSTCGFGSTGSSAVSDYLLECENTCILDGIEFTISTMADGLEDLDFHLNKQHSRTESSAFAIRRFIDLVKDQSKIWRANTKICKKEIDSILNEYIESITQIKFLSDPIEMSRKEYNYFNHYFGYSLFMHRLIYRLERKHYIKSNHNYFPLKEMFVSIEPKDFIKNSQKFVSRLLAAMGAEKGKILVLDQAFSGDNPGKSFPFFKDPYAIVTDRDPRDLFIFSNEVLLSRGRFMPNNVDEFIRYYRLLRDNQPYKQNNDRILVLQFESLIYEYEKTADMIDNFLGVENKKRKTILIPEISVANTNLVRRFPKYKEAVRKIENALPEYIFHFENYPQIKGSEKMFYGKSPLNKK